MRSSMKHAVYEGRDYCRILKKKPANANCVFFCNIATFMSCMYHQKSILITIVSTIVLLAVKVMYTMKRKEREY